MQPTGDSAREACALVRELRDVLTGLGDALAAHDLDAVLSAEPRLAAAASAIDRLTRTGSLPPAAGGELAGAHRALDRCRRLGDGLRLFAAATEAAQGRGPEYSPRPGRAAGGLPRGLTARA